MSVAKGRAGQVTKVRTTCSYCGVGCNFDLNVRGGKIIRVTSVADAPVNGMALCVKGRYGYDYVHNRERLQRPLVRAKWLEGVKERVEGGEWRVETGELREESGEWTVAPAYAGGGEWRVAQKASRRVTYRTSSPIYQSTNPRHLHRSRLGHGARHGGSQAGGGEASLWRRVLCHAGFGQVHQRGELPLAKLTRQLMETNSIDHCARL